MKLLSFASVLFLIPLLSSPASAQGSGDPPCIPEGQCGTICGQRPEEWDGMPAGPIHWAGGTGQPHAWEDDPAVDDDMGGAHIQPDGSACYTICNNGLLQDENGHWQNGTGTLEGDCLEVKICYTYYETVSVTTTDSHTSSSGGSVSVKGSGGSGGATSGSSHTHTTATTQTIKVKKKVCTDIQNVCAC